ncbi:GNAT family N-acetyltransferase [Myceligenerans xiligouense]|uniref:RimJ/RimL family protein N-acetyltransferase n=1 Tax=Myceligenerans xiligouense TaxID=253184 RepID=A0A3N4YJT8_9MICO|nr:GNAT family protein [Myceligenerans xiligouense]RPF20367.1 RimJ/RimL family protein N-acetyltransferase [Myceligenerans xiligouense]
MELTINEDTAPDLWLTHDGVGLGPLRADLLESYWRWENSLPVMAGYARQTPESLTERTAGLDHQLSDTETQTRFTIYRDHTDSSDGEVWRPVGMASLLVDDRYRTAEFFIYIGEPAERGRGTGTAATTMVLDWAFHVAALRCVHLSVIAQNTGAIRSYEKAGFRIVGTRRRTGSWLGQPADEVIMDAIPEDYTGPRLVEAAVLGTAPGTPRQVRPS